MMIMTAGGQGQGRGKVQTNRPLPDTHQMSVNNDMKRTLDVTSTGHSPRRDVVFRGQSILLFPTQHAIVESNKEGSDQ